VPSPIDIPFHAVPLRIDDGPASHGLLLVASSGPELPVDVLWLSRLLSKQVERLITRQSLAEMRFGE
jgi:hypothetical protein